MNTKRGIAVWLATTAMFLAALNSFSAVFLVANQGAEAVMTPQPLGGIFGGLAAETHLWISIALTAVFLGATCIIVYHKQPPHPDLIKMLLKIGGNLAALRTAQEASVTEIADQLEFTRKTNQKLISKAGQDLEETKKEMLEQLAVQKRAIKKSLADLASTVEEKLAKTEGKLIAELAKQEAAVNGVKRLSEDSASALKNQLQELEEIKERLETLQQGMQPNQPVLKSFDDPEEIKGIGPSLGKELRSLGITSVGEFITTDPEIIGEKTRVSKEMAENLQAAAQLMMVPGIDSDDAEMLIEAGVKSRRELAEQEVIQLSRKVGEVAKVYIGQGKISRDEAPTIEEISAWIRLAR